MSKYYSPYPCMGAWRRLCAWPYSQNMGLGKIAFCRADVDVHDVMDSAGSQSIFLKVHPHNLTILSMLF